MSVSSMPAGEAGRCLVSGLNWLSGTSTSHGSPAWSSAPALTLAVYLPKKTPLIRWVVMPK